MAASESLPRDLLLRSILDKESLEDFAPVLSWCGSSPGAKSRLGKEDIGVGFGCVCGFTDGCEARGVSFRGTLGGGGGEVGGREAKDRADCDRTVRLTADRANNAGFILMSEIDECSGSERAQ